MVIAILHKVVVKVIEQMHLECLESHHSKCIFGIILHNKVTYLKDQRCSRCSLNVSSLPLSIVLDHYRLRFTGKTQIR